MMLTIATNSKGRYFLLAVLSVIFFAAVVSISVTTTHNKKLPAEAPALVFANPEPQTGVVRYLPEGAKIADPNKDVLSADLIGDGQREEIIFFTVPQQDKAGITVLKPAGGDYVKVWEEFYDSRSFSEPTGVYNLNKTGKPQIFAYHTVGASCPGALEIYEYRDGKIERVSGPWAFSGHCETAEIKDLNHDKHQEIIITTRNYEANSDVYSWSGNGYVKANGRFPEFYNDALPSLIADVYSAKAMPVSARIAPAKRAVEIYLLQRRYAEAVALCNAVIRMIEDAKLTRSNSIVKDDQNADQRDRNSAMFEIEKVEAKATIHHLLTNIY